MSTTSRTSALTDIRLVSGTLQLYPGLRLEQRILIVLNLLHQNLQKSGYLKTQQMVPLNIKTIKVIFIYKKSKLIKENIKYKYYLFLFLSYHCDKQNTLIL